MGLFVGGGTVSGVFVGDRAASAVWLGGVQVWPVVEPEIERPLVPEVIDLGDGDPLLLWTCCVNGSGSRLFIVAYDVDEQQMFLLAVSTRSLRVVDRIELPVNPTDSYSVPLQVVAVDDGAFVFLQNFGGNVLRVDVSERTVDEVYVAAAISLSCRLAVHPSGDRVYAYSNTNVVVIDVETGGWDEFRVPGGAGANIAFDMGIHSREWSDPALFLAAGRVLEMDTGSNSFVNEFGPPTFGGFNGFVGRSLVPLSEELWVLGGGGDAGIGTSSIRVVDYYGNIIGDDIPVGFKNPTSELALFIRDSISTTATEQTAFVFQFGLEQIAAVNTVSRDIVGVWPIREPRSLAVHPAGDRFYVIDGYGQLHVQPYVEGEVTTIDPDVDETIFGQGTFSYQIPDWAQRVDVVAVGGGAGGEQGGALNAPGDGGGAGRWAAKTLRAGVDFTVGQTLSVQVGAGGRNIPSGKPSDSGNGKTSEVKLNNTVVVSAPGGRCKTATNQWGASPGKYLFGGNTYQGGVTNQTLSAPGGVPGAGGSGGKGVLVGVIGAVGTNGGDGGYGRVWIRAFRTTRSDDRSSRSMREGASLPPFKGGWQETENGFTRT